jgi:hypothetical protein
MTVWNGTQPGTVLTLQPGETQDGQLIVDASVSGTLINAGQTLIRPGYALGHEHNFALKISGDTTLTGGGNLDLDWNFSIDDNPAHIFDISFWSISGGNVTFENFDNLITGFSTINISLYNNHNPVEGTIINDIAGVIDATNASNELFLSTATLFNSGLLEATAAGGLRISTDYGIYQSSSGTILAQGGDVLVGSGPIVNDGLLEADGSTLTLLDTTTGSGTALVTHGGTLNFIGLFEENVTFAGAGSLILKSISPYTGVISGFNGSDQIQVKARSSDDLVTYDTTAHTITTQKPDGSNPYTYQFDSNTPVQFIQVSDNLGVDTLTICFMAGTLVRTPGGEAAIETLRPGDLVLTHDGLVKRVNWLGRQTVSTAFADPLRRLPIRVRAGALGENVPCRDLLVSPDHALLVEGVLIQSGALVNGSSIVRETRVPTVFVYYHVELDDHSLILAENTPAETFVDNVERLHFDNWAEFEALYPEGKVMEELPYPRAKAHRQLPTSIRRVLADRAVAIGAAAKQFISLDSGLVVAQTASTSRRSVG